MKRSLFVITLVLALLGCRSQNLTETDSLPDFDIPLNDMNKKIVLHETVGMMDVYNETGLIFLDLENLSSSQVSFPPDYGSKIFIQDEKGWLPIGNEFSYSNDAPITLPTEKQYPLGLSLSILPILPETSGKLALRIIVIGKTVDNNETVGAYLDIVLE